MWPELIVSDNIVLFWGNGTLSVHLRVHAYLSLPLSVHALSLHPSHLHHAHRKNIHFPPSLSHPHVDGDDSWNHSVTGWLSGTILLLSFRGFTWLYIFVSPSLIIISGLEPSHSCSQELKMLNSEYNMWLYQFTLFHLFSFKISLNLLTKWDVLFISTNKISNQVPFF